MLVFLEREEHKKLKEISFKNGTFPHRVLVEIVKHLNKKGLPKWLINKCVSGHQESIKKSGRPKLPIANIE